MELMMHDTLTQTWQTYTLYTLKVGVKQYSLT